MHCNSGKGRTGTAICSILLFIGFHDNLDDCLRFYGHQRFTCGKGVSQPCQLRYLYYFEAFYRKQIKSPSVKRLRAIEFSKIPTVSGRGVVPFFEVYHCHGLETKLIFTYAPTRWYLSKEGSACFKLSASEKKICTLHGDIKIIFKHHGFSDTMLFRIMFNTAFIKQGEGYILASKLELSPEDIRKDKGSIIPNNFKLTMFFDDFCQTCNPETTEIEDLCKRCQEELGPEEIDDWLRTREILRNHEFPDRRRCEEVFKGVDSEIEKRHLE